jgi:hypothetical protein
MPRRTFVLLTLYCAALTHAQPPDSGRSAFTFLPGRSIYLHAPASFEEPRIGLAKDVSSSHMNLDIGGGMDLLNIRVSDDSTSNLRVGADIFAYALSTSRQGLRLQIDAVDGYFGGHLVYRLQKAHTALLLRVRVLHLSSHLLDGHYDLNNNVWIDGRLPNPFSRDYGEVTAGHVWQWDSSGLVVYGGFSYATLVRPTTVKRLNTLYGVTMHTARWVRSCFGRPMNFYISTHLLLWGMGTLSSTNVAEAGVKFGAWEGEGLRVFIKHHAGLEVYHQYSDVKNNAISLGFCLEP